MSMAFVPCLPASTTSLSSTRSAWTWTCVNSKVDGMRLAVRRTRPNLTSNYSPSMNVDDTETTTNTTSSKNTNTSSSSEVETEGFKAPSLNTTAFSDFIENAQGKVSELQERIQDIDSDKLMADSVDSGKRLIDNFLAGDWLNRGEVYGAIQIALVLLLFRKPVTMDVLVALITGPMLIAAGIGISGKALFDLGINNISIWPAPVPDGTLKTDGLYQVVRHPIYSGLLLSSIGFAVATHSPARLAICVGFAILMAKKVTVEEEFLSETYEGYEEYKEEVPFKLIPKVY